MVRPVTWMAALAALATGGAASAQQTASAEPVKAKIICKRDTDTGSLVAKKRRCHTRHEWDRIAEAARMNAQYEMDRNMSRPGGQ